MGLFEDFLDTVGAVLDRTHIFTFLKDSEDGVYPRLTRDLRPAPEDGLTGGELLELYVVFDRRHSLDANSVLRLDILEEDWLFTGRLDDRATSLLGTGATPPEDDAPARQLTTVVRDLPTGQALPRFVEDYKRSRNDFADTMLVIRENPADAKPGDRRSYVIAWYRLEHQADDIGELSEFYFVVDLGDGELQAASPVVEIAEAAPGTSVRVRGTLADLQPFGAAAEPLEDVPVTLGGRRSVSDDQGVFLLDARLPVGTHPLRVDRPGIDPVDLAVEVTAAANGRMRAAVLDPDGNELVSATTPQAATEASVVELTIAAPITVRVHKLRGTVFWPDSRPGNVAANYRGTPLGKRHVYVLPLPAGARIQDHRPKTTRQWESLKKSPGVLRSTRPGRPRDREATALDGRFEVKYVDFGPDNRFLIWAERVVAGPVAGTTAEEPDHVVRTFRQELIQLTQADDDINPDDVDALNRNLVDHEYNFGKDDVVPYGVDALRTAQFPAGRRLVRPRRDLAAPDGLRQMRDRFDTDAALVPGVDEERPVANTRIVDGLEVQVLPLVPLHEPPEAQGEAVRRVRQALATAAAAAYPDYVDPAFPAPVPAPATPRFGGYDAGTVRLALDANGLVAANGLPGAVSMAAADWPGADEPNDAARVVKLLESTFVVRDQLGVGRGQTLSVGQARWHFDAVSLADGAFVSPSPAGVPLIRNRRLDATVVPVFGAVSPRLPGLGACKVYVAPGHGLFPTDGFEASADPARWESERGGWGANAGEDEVGAFMASEMRRIAVLNGGSVVTCRELVDFTLPGVSNPANGRFVPVTAAANRDFPRLWQQNPIYYLGSARDPVVTAPPANPATAVNWPNPASPGMTKNGHGIDARREHIRAAARAAEPISLVVAPHTDAFDQATRGTAVEYLNMLPAGGGPGEGNPLGRSFARQLAERLITRCRTRRRRSGVFTMSELNSYEVTDLTGTFDHFVENTVADPELERRRADIVSPGAAWTDKPFPQDVRPNPPVAPKRIPVALSEFLLHDQADDAALLSRAWFRRLAAEATAMAMDNQLRDDQTPVAFPVVRRMLRNTFGDSAAVRALAAGAVTPASIQATVVAVADPAPAPAVPANASLGSLAETVTVAVRAYTRQELVDALVAALREKAGWQSDDQLLDIEEFLIRPITGGLELERPDDPPTRAEAGAFACLAVGITPATLAAAETERIGDSAAPLLAPAPAPPGVVTTYFPRTEANLLVARLDELEPEDIYNVADAWLAGASWAPLDSPRGSGTYELDAGTPLVVVVRTAGVAWKADDQNGTDEPGDAEIRVEVGCDDRTLACTYRDGRVAVSETWALDLPPSDTPREVTVDLRVDHPDEGWTKVGEKLIRLKVAEPQA